MSGSMLVGNLPRGARILSLLAILATGASPALADQKKAAPPPPKAAPAVKAPAAAVKGVPAGTTKGTMQGGAGTAHVPSSARVPTSVSSPKTNAEVHAPTDSGKQAAMKPDPAKRGGEAASPRRDPGTKETHERRLEERRIAAREEARREGGPPHYKAEELAFVRQHEHDFHTRDVRHFHEREFAAWRAGRWHDEWRYGRRGWWWEVDGVWYPYVDPVFPYPLVVAPLVVEGSDVAAVPPGALPNIEPAAGRPGMADAPPPATPGREVAHGSAETPPPVGDGERGADQPKPTQAQFLPPRPKVAYRCEAPEGFYPNVSACDGGWQQQASMPDAAVH